MPDYEMMYILRPDLSEDQVQQSIEEYRDFLKEYNAQAIEVKIWGKRRLAYPIQKFQDGLYILMNYQADGTQVAPLEKAMRLGEKVIRYLTLQVEEPVTVSEDDATEDSEETESAATARA